MCKNLLHGADFVSALRCEVFTYRNVTGFKDWTGMSCLCGSCLGIIACIRGVLMFVLVANNMLGSSVKFVSKMCGILSLSWRQVNHIAMS
jgi:hypothetical protein